MRQSASCLRLTWKVEAVQNTAHPLAFPGMASSSHTIPGKARGCAVFWTASNFHLIVDCFSSPFCLLCISVYRELDLLESHPKRMLSNIHTQSREREHERNTKASVIGRLHLPIILQTSDKISQLVIILWTNL